MKSSHIRFVPAFALPLVALVACGSRTEAPPPRVSAPVSPPACASASAAPVAPAPAPTARRTDLEGVKEELLRRINAKDSAGVMALFSQPMKDALPMEKTAPFVEGLVSAKGALDPASGPSAESGPKRGVYRVKAERGEWQLELVVDREGQILGMRFGEPPPADPPVVRSTIPLGLPFRGAWTVFWGGDRLEVNQHVNHSSQRRAADLVIAGADGQTHKGEGKKNEDYFAYGKEVLAVADGTVVTAIDGVADNEPGAMNPYVAPGNMVIVRHDGGLWSVYAHLIPGKLRVRAGFKVRRGTVLGLCGNSGNSSEPHLHFQVQDGPHFEKSYGVEAVFAGVTRKRAGQTSKEDVYTFLKGDEVSPSP